MSLSPDIAGFRAAQKRLRQVLGVDATFLIPQTRTWDPAEPLDPDTGKPYDPFAEPATGGDYDEVAKRVSWVSRPLGAARAAAGEFSESPIGNVSEAVSAVIVDSDDYDDVADATRVRVNGVEWQIEQVRHDELAGDSRWLFFLEDA